MAIYHQSPSLRARAILRRDKVTDLFSFGSSGIHRDSMATVDGPDVHPDNSGEAESAVTTPAQPTHDVEESAAKSLFLGQIIEENLFPFPGIRDEELETTRLVVDSVRKFMEQHRDDFAKYDRQGAQPPHYIESLKELGLFGLVIPEEYGGLGLSNLAYARIIQETSRYDASTSLTVGAHSSIGMKGLLLFGSDEQKQRYLPRLATGEMIAAFCLTEPGSGSDAASIASRAEKDADGSWRLSGEKIWITNGPIADFFTVFARTDSDEGKISAFLVERSWDGVSVGSKEDKLGIRASATSTVSFDNVRVPSENLLGEEGKGFKIAMSILNNGRTGLGGGCVGGLKTCIELASAHVVERKQFGQPIAQFGLVQGKIAQMTIDCFVTESIVTMLGHYIDSGVKDF
ncbi:MAG: acyl-CoA dehydrogenase family protein, partial [Bdellovibrionales bacterium]|nr:acyl-CoA dehydrogenase family protein [Bdellovibrionales bacterium]